MWEIAIFCKGCKKGVAKISKALTKLQLRQDKPEKEMQMLTNVSLGK